MKGVLGVARSVVGDLGEQPDSGSERIPSLPPWSPWLDLLPVGVALVGADLCIHRTNPPFRKWLAISADDITGKQVHQIIPDDVGPLEQLCIRALETARTQQMLFPVQHGQTSESSIRPADITIQPARLQEDSKPCLLILVHDAWHRVTVAHSERQHRDLVGRLTEELADTRRRCEESERELQQFLAITTHNLRTPLTSVKAYAQLARMKLERLMDEPELASGQLPGLVQTIVDYLRKADVEATRLAQLITELEHRRATR